MVQKVGNLLPSELGLFRAGASLQLQFLLPFATSLSHGKMVPVKTPGSAASEQALASSCRNGTRAQLKRRGLRSSPLPSLIPTGFPAGTPLGRHRPNQHGNPFPNSRVSVN